MLYAATECVYLAEILHNIHLPLETNRVQRGKLVHRRDPEMAA